MIKEQPNTLLKCPFCGGEAKLVKTHDGMYGIFHESEGCPIDAVNFVCDWQYDTAKEAISAWNTRKPVDDVVEALKKPIWIEHTDDLTLNEIAETAIKQTREVAIERVKEILNE